MPKGIYDRSASNWQPRRADDSPVLVEKIRQLYESGLTITEVQRLVPGCKVQRVMEQHGIPRRRAIKRDQHGDRNHAWRGDDAGYQALHLRVQTERGKPQLCEWCGTTEGRMEWANISGDYADVNDYSRLCIRCHRTYDAARRAATGERTSPVRRSA